mmetsp:Transcript_23464/g.54550  ORF Transcript_23464/g.54550 Transcript_23464/m.54550 type:complete len:346 (-) Transcript_23464:8-1045(-)
MSLSQFCSSSNDSAPVPLLSHLSRVSLMNCLCFFFFSTISFLRELWLARLEGTTLITLVVVIFSLGFSIVGSFVPSSGSRAYQSESALESSGGVMTPLPRVSLVDSTQSTSASGTGSPSLRAVRSSASCGLSRYAEWSLSNFLNMASISSLLSTYDIQACAASLKSSGRTDASSTVEASPPRSLAKPALAKFAMLCTHLTSPSSGLVFCSVISVSQLRSSSKLRAPVPLVSHLLSVSWMNLACCFFLSAIAFLLADWFCFFTNVTPTILPAPPCSQGFSPRFPPVNPFRLGDFPPLVCDRKASAFTPLSSGTPATLWPLCSPQKLPLSADTKSDCSQTTPVGTYF